MHKKLSIILGLAAITLATVGFAARSGSSAASEEVGVPVTAETETADAPLAAADAPVKEFELEAYNSMEDGKYAPKFSLNEIRVDKGDLVRIKVNVTSGMHDFKLDEFGVHSATPEGEVTVIEFVADEAGEFLYYCNMGRHREMGQWGTLVVME